MLLEAPFPISCLALMLFYLSSMLDSGKHDDISVEEVKEHACLGDLIQFLNERAEAKEGGDTFDNGYSKLEPKFTDWYVTQLRNNCQRMHQEECRRYGIESRGLCLLISYTAEILQHGKNIRLA